MLSADLPGEDLLRAMQTTPATEYVLVEPAGSVYGVLVDQGRRQGVPRRLIPRRNVHTRLGRP